MKRIIIVGLTVLSLGSAANAGCAWDNLGHCVDNLADAAKDVVTAGGHGRDRDKQRKQEEIERERIKRNERINGLKNQRRVLKEVKNHSERNIEFLENSVNEASENAETFNYLSEGIKDAIMNISISHNYSAQQAKNVSVFKQEINKLLIGLTSEEEFHKNNSFINSLNFLSEAGFENIDEINAAIEEIGKSLNNDDSVRMIELLKHSNRVLERELYNYNNMLHEEREHFFGISTKLEKINNTLSNMDEA